ncbi:GTP-binding protein [Neisseria meningitidis]|nr:GTP-binding protein [Neisseria meningitidis]
MTTNPVPIRPSPTVRLTTPIKLTLEGAVEFIDDDELVEITPQSIRLRKRYLSELERRRHFKKLD